MGAEGSGKEDMVAGTLPGISLLRKASLFVLSISTGLPTTTPYPPHNILTDNCGAAMFTLAAAFIWKLSWDHSI